METIFLGTPTNDATVMKNLKEGKEAAIVLAKKRDPVEQQAKLIVWEVVHLLGVWLDGDKKVIP
jgi:hypothetical protein